MGMLIGHNHDGSNVTLEPKELTTHCVVLGRTGSGKTGATVALVEEAVLSGASVIVIDPKGDLTNLALVFPDLTSQEFAPWTEDGEDPTLVSDRVRRGLGSLSPNVKKWKDSRDISLYTPGEVRKGGQGVNILSSLAPPVGLNTSIRRERASATVTSILNAIGHKANNLTDPATVFLTEAVVHLWSKGVDAGLDAWVSLLLNPPQELGSVDGIALSDFFPAQKRMKIARAIVGFKKQAAKWLNGQPLLVDNLIGRDRPKVSVFTLRHLDETDRQFFSSMLLNSIVDYMFRAPASQTLKLVVVIDEARGYLPPYPINPPTKKPICTILSQGRAHGIGMIIGTQNPNDLDYKALTNVGTWLLGNLRERDCARDLRRELTDRNIDLSSLSKIQPRSFLIVRRDGACLTTKIRWTYSFLRGPMNSDDIARYYLTSAHLADHKIIGNGLIKVPFYVRSQERQLARVRLQFSKDGGVTWGWCSLKENYDYYSGSPKGLHYQFLWDTSKDFPAERTAGMLRMWVEGVEPCECALFDVDNTSRTEEHATLQGSRAWMISGPPTKQS